MKTEKKPSHTLGPWRVSGCRMESKSGVLRPMIEHGDDMTSVPLIAELYDRGDKDRMEADARLIAAAPELLAALKVIKDAHYDCLAPSECRAENRLCIPCIVGDAIAKAEGREVKK